MTFLGELVEDAGPTLSRGLAEIDDASLDRLDTARAKVRARVWDPIRARHGRVPAALVPTGDLGDTTVLRIDAHVIDTVSRKQGAARLRGPPRPPPDGRDLR